MLANALGETPRKSRQGLPCPMATILSQLDERDRSALEAELSYEVGDPRRLSNAVLARALRESGHYTHEKGVERHRNHSCRCFAGRS